MTAAKKGIGTIGALVDEKESKVEGDVDIAWVDLEPFGFV
jgi:hypothetical protein